MSFEKDIKSIIRSLTEKGFLIKKGKKHFKVSMNGKLQICFSSTPSDSHAIQNILADIRRVERKLFLGGG